jgi:hypothetical protein
MYSPDRLGLAGGSDRNRPKGSRDGRQTVPLAHPLQPLMILMWPLELGESACVALCTGPEGGEQTGYDHPVNSSNLFEPASGAAVSTAAPPRCYA